MNKFEITQVLRDTESVISSMVDNEGNGRFIVKYRVRINKKLTIESEEVLFAKDELDAYNRAKHFIKAKHKIHEEI